MNVERHQNDVLLLDAQGQVIETISQEQAVDMAKRLLDTAGKVLSEDE